MSERFWRRDARINALIGSGHFLSHFYALCLPPVFLAWQKAFGVPFAELGLSVALLASAQALAQTPIGFLVDRYGARPFLIAGTLVMSLSISMMGFATAYWQIVMLALLSGIGNSVFHPADYAILSGSVSRERIGRSFSIHTFNGYAGFSAAPPVTVGLMLMLGWRETLMLLGLMGVPVALLVLTQGHILTAKTHEGAHMRDARAAGGRFLLTRPMLLFCGFYMVSSMATAGMQSWLITVLHQTRGMALTMASSALTGYLVASMAGILVGGWLADRSPRHLILVVLLSVGAAGLILSIGVLPAPDFGVFALLALSGLLIGGTRTPRDMMVREASPAGEIGKAFGFVSAGLSLGGAVMPVPYGMLIDAGRPRLVLVVVAALLLVSLLLAAGARLGSASKVAAAPAE